MRLRENKAWSDFEEGKRSAVYVLAQPGARKPPPKFSDSSISMMDYARQWTEYLGADSEPES